METKMMRVRVSFLMCRLAYMLVCLVGVKQPKQVVSLFSRAEYLKKELRTTKVFFNLWLKNYRRYLKRKNAGSMSELPLKSIKYF
jgi:hypothetical protein